MERQNLSGVEQSGTWDALRAMLPGFRPPADGKVRGLIVTAEPTPDRVRRVRLATPRTPDGYDTPVYFVHPSLADADAHTCIVESLAEDPAPHRFHVFGGDSCADALGAWFAQHPERALPADLLGQPWNPVTQAVLRCAEQALGCQRDEVGRLRAKLAGGPSDAELAHRWSRIGSGLEAADVMIVTSRYTTYVRHAADDLAETLTRLGHTARVVLEPDSACVATAAHYLRSIDAHRPDLIVSVNFPRAMMGNAIPAGWPFVCWVQDAMRHLFEKSDQTATTRDFVAGHRFPTAFSRAGYAPDRVLEFPVSVSTTKFFHVASPDRGDAVDVAYVSHRSQTPERFARKIAGELGVPGKIIEDVVRRIRAVVETWAEPGHELRLEMVSRDLAPRLGMRDEETTFELIRTQIVLPIADQVIRDTMLGWAADIADAHGLNLRLFGRGWASHPRLRDYAGGPLEHGDDLRACYQNATVHLHASVLGCGHQRIYECALAGGLPLCMRSIDEVHRHDEQLIRHFLKAGVQPDVSFVHNRQPGYLVANHPELMALQRCRQRTPMPATGWTYTSGDCVIGNVYCEHRPRPYLYPLLPKGTLPLSTLGDPFEATFSTKLELESRVLRAREHPTWRNAVSDGLRRRVLTNVSMDGFAASMLGMVERAFTSDASAHGEDRSAMISAA